jgi:hypothetical protein
MLLHTPPRFARQSANTSGPPSKARSRAAIDEEEEEEFDEIDEQEAVAVLLEAGEDVTAVQVGVRTVEG